MKLLNPCMNLGGPSEPLLQFSKFQATGSVSYHTEHLQASHNLPQFVLLGHAASVLVQP